MVPARASDAFMVSSLAQHARECDQCHYSYPRRLSVALPTCHRGVAQSSSRSYGNAAGCPCGL